MGLRDDLETRMQKCTERDVKTDDLARKWLDRLEAEGEHLLKTGRHAWVRAQARSLNSGGNWDGYAMTVHLTYTLEEKGIACSNEQKLIPGEDSDVDIVYEDSGVRVAMECVAVQEPADFWTPEEADPEVEGLYLQEISERGTDYQLQMMRAQHKVRIKTVRAARDDSGNTMYTTPCKFPTADEQSLHIMAIDMSRGLGDMIDYYDLVEMCYGSRCVPVYARQGGVLGLFEKENPYGDAFASIFAGNDYLRNRIHGILFLLDKSSMHCSLDPEYDAWFAQNPLLIYSPTQAIVANNLGKALTDLVKAWLTKPDVSIE